MTDSGSLFAIIECGLKPVVVDSANENTFNTSAEEIAAAVNKNTAAIFLVHCGGIPMTPTEMRKIKGLGIPIVEDCSQAPFAKYCSLECKNECKSCISNEFVGTLGDVACFSTMYRKTIHTGASGGIVFTKNERLYKRIIEESDRGREKWNSNVNLRDPGDCSHSALNHNTNEFSCAIGLASLNRVTETINKRLEFLNDLSNNLRDKKIFQNL